MSDIKITTNVDLNSLSPALQDQIRKEIEAKNKRPEEKTTLVYMLLDRSGSMGSIKADTIGGVNNFIKSQRGGVGKCKFTLMQFDTQSPHEIVQNFVDIESARELTEDSFQPRGGTPLMDAIGYAITDCEVKVAQQTVDLVVFVIVTDGGENESKEVSLATVKDRIAKSTAKGWQFVYLGAGIDAMKDAGTFGFCASSTLNVSRSHKGIACAYGCAGQNLTAYRVSGGDARTMAFSAETRSLQQQEGAVPSSTVTAP